MTDRETAVDEELMVEMHQIGMRDYREGRAMNPPVCPVFEREIEVYIAGYRGAQRRAAAARRDQRQVAAALCGTRVELHPSTDWWMKGARFGTIVRAGKTYMRVKLDANDKVVRVHGDLLQPIGE